jgi:hypothetical protein
MLLLGDDWGSIWIEIKNATSYLIHPAASGKKMMKYWTFTTN